MFPPSLTLKELFYYILGLPISQGSANPPPPEEDGPLSPGECYKMRNDLAELIGRSSFMKGMSAAFGFSGTVLIGVALYKDKEQDMTMNAMAVVIAGLAGGSYYYSSRFDKRIDVLGTQISRRCNDQSKEVLAPQGSAKVIPFQPRKNRSGVIERDFTPEIIAASAAVGGMALAGIRAGGAWAVGRLAPVASRAAAGAAATASAIGTWYWHGVWGL